MAPTIRSSMCLAGPLLWMLLVAGCSSGPERPVAANSRAETCEPLMADPRIDPMRGRIAVPISLDASQDVSNLSDRSRPTDAERPAIKALWDAHEACRALSEARFGPLPRYRASSHEAVSALLGELHEGTITYGQFARKLLYIGAQDQSARETLDDELEARARWKAMDAAATKP